MWSNYPDLFAALPYFRFFWNTFLYAAVTIVGVCASSSLVAYGFSRLRWPGRDTLFYVMLMTLILPFACTLIPLFVMYKRFGWIGTYLPLEVPTFFGSSVFSTFLLRQFFMTIPHSLSEAARIDGANEFYIYSRIILPLAKPALASVILFQFVYCWNDYLGPLVYISNTQFLPAVARPVADPRGLHHELGLGHGRRHRGDRADRHLVLPDPAHVHPGNHPHRAEGMTRR